MRIGLSSQVEISVSSTETASQLKKRLKDIMEVAAIKALEAAVERTPAAGETPYSTGQLRQSIRVRRVEDLEFELDEYYVFSKHDVELLYDPKLNIDKDLIRMFQTLSKQDRWNLNVSNKKDDSIRINNSEFNFITKRISYKDFFMEKKDTYEIMLILNHLDFSNYLWSFTSIKDKSKLKAYIKDEDFKIRVKNGSIKFGYRDIIHCIIERNHYSILNNIDLSKAQYSIIKVLNIIHNSEQLSFDI